MKTTGTDDIDAQSLTIVGIFGAVVTFLIIIGVQVLYYRLEKADEFNKFAVPGYVELRSVQAEQRASLNDYHWVDKQKGLVTIPIERAMDLMTVDLQEQK